LPLIKSTQDFASVYETKITSITPNPTNGETKISYSIAEEGNINMVLINFLGQEIMKLESRHIGVGEHTKTFSIQDFPTGIYFLKLIHNENIIIEKLIKN
jgi:hypothetical protein